MSHNIRHLMYVILVLSCINHGSQGDTLPQFFMYLDLNTSVTAKSATTILPPPVVSIYTISEAGHELFIDASVSIRIAASLVPISNQNQSVNSSVSMAALAGTTIVDVKCGLALFSDLSIDLVGRYLLNFSLAGSSISVSSNPFHVEPGAAASLVIVSEPNGVRPIWPFQQQPLVEVRDAGGNLVVNTSLTITASVVTNDLSSPVSGQGQLALISSSNYAGANNGVADFSLVPCSLCEGPLKRGLSLSIPFGGARLRFSASSVPPVLSRPFDVSLWPPVRLSVAGLPAIVASGATLAPRVLLLDSFGRLVSWAAAGEQTNVTARLRPRVTVPSTLQGSLTAAVAAGVASYTDLALGYASGGYILDFAAATTLPQIPTAVTSPSLVVTSGPPFRLTLGASSGAAVKRGAQPVGGPATGPLPGQPTVVIMDRYGNWAAAAVSVTAVLQSLDGAAAAELAGTAAVLSCRTAQDAAALACDCAAAGSVCGVAQFTDLRVAAAGAYTLAFAAAGLRPVASARFDVVPGPAYALRVARAPAGLLAGAPFLAQPAVTVEDRAGNAVPAADGAQVRAFLLRSSASVTVAAAAAARNLSADPQATFMGAAVVAGGVAAFSGLAVPARCAACVFAFDFPFGPGPGPGPGLPPLYTAPLAVAGHPAALASPWRPAPSAGGEVLPPVAVAAVDAGGLPSDWLGSRVPPLAVTAALCARGADAGTRGGGGGAWECGADGLLGGGTAALVGGAAVFTDLGVGPAGLYRVRFALGTLALLTDPFRVSTGPPAQLAVLYSPEPAVRPGAPFAAQPAVVVRDAGGNAVADGDAGTVTARLIAAPPGADAGGAAAEALLLWLPDRPPAVRAERGVAWFFGLRVDRAGSGYRLGFASSLSAVAPAASAAFAVVAGPPATLAVAAQPRGCAAAASGGGGQAECDRYAAVAVLDGGGNAATNASCAAVAAQLINASTGRPVAPQPPPFAAASGWCEWEALAAGPPGADYALAFSSPGLDPARTGPFPIAAAAAALRLAGGVVWGFVPGAAAARQPVVRVVDASGVPAEAAGGITVAVELLGPAAAALRGTTVVVAAGGAAAFTDLRIDSPGACYSFRFSARGLAAAATAPFAVAVGPSAAVRVVTQPAGAVPGRPLAVQPVVALTDAGGNLAAAEAGVRVTASILGLPPDALQGRKVLDFAGGLAQFAQLRADTATGCMRLLFASLGRTPARSAPVAVRPLPAVALGVAAGFQPRGAAPGRPLAVQPRVEARDEFGNVDPGAAGVAVTAVLVVGDAEADCAGALQCLVGTELARVGVDGVARFTNLRIDRAGPPGANYSLRFRADGLTQAESEAALEVRASAGAVQLSVVQEPLGFVLGRPFAQQPAVGAVDEGGNLVMGASSFVVSAEIVGAATAALVGSKLALALSGVARFTDLEVGVAGANLTLRFSATSDEYGPAVSQPFDVPTEMAGVELAVQPAGAVAGRPFSVQPVVRGRDGFGRAISSYDSALTAQLLPLSVPSRLQGTTEVAYSVAGLGTFTDLRLDIALMNESYVLNFSYGLFWVISDPIIVSSGPGVQMELIGKHLDEAVALEPLQPTPTIRVLDVFGNNDMQVVHQITATLVSPNRVVEENVFVGSNKVTTDQGIANFLNLSCSLALMNVYLHFTSKLLASVDSGRFNVLAGKPTMLKLRTSPLYFFVNRLLSPQPSVTVLDKAGNIVPVNGNVSVKLLNATGCPAVGKEITKNPVSTDTTNTLSARNITVAAENMSSVYCGKQIQGLHVVQPFCPQEYLRTQMALCCRAVLASTGSSGSILQKSSIFNGTIAWNLVSMFQLAENILKFDIDVTLQQASDHAQCIAEVNTTKNLLLYMGVNQSFQQNQSLFRQILFLAGLSLENATITSNTSASSIPSCLSLDENMQTLQSLSLGVLDFQGLVITEELHLVKLQFSFDTLQADSETFDVSSDATNLAFVHGIGGKAEGGSVFVHQPLLGLFDSSGRLVTFYDYVVSASLVCNDGLSYCQDVAGGRSFRCQGPVSVCAYDANSCPKLLGTTEIYSKKGQAEFHDLAITTCNDAAYSSSQKYSCIRGQFSILFEAKLYSTFGRFRTVSVMSNSLAIIPGAPNNLAIEVNPSLMNTAGQAFSVQPTVVILDRGGNRAIGNGINNSVSALIMMNSSQSNNRDLLLGGRTYVIALFGMVSYTNLAVYAAGSSFSIMFTTPQTINAVYTSMFSVMAAKAYQLDVIGQPSTGFGGELLQKQPLVQISDAWSNRVVGSVSFQYNITATLATNNEQQATLLDLASTVQKAPATMLSIEGLVVFTSLAVDSIGVCYSIIFTSLTLVKALSQTFDVTEGSPFKLTVYRNPDGFTPGYVFPLQPIVWVQDRGGNLNARRYTGDLVASIWRFNGVNSTKTSSSLKVLKGTPIVSTVQGAALWTDLRVDSVGNFRIGFDPVFGAMQTVFTVPFDVLPGPPTMLAILTQPLSGKPGDLLAIQPEISVQDAAGNTIQSSGIQVQALLFQNGLPSPWPLSGPACNTFHCSGQCSTVVLCPDPKIRCPTCTNVTIDPGIVFSEGGIAKYQLLAVEVAGRNFSIRFVSMHLVAVDSLPINILAGKSYQIRLLQQASGFLAGAIFRVQPIVGLEDIGNNTVNVSGYVVMSLETVEDLNVQVALFPRENLNITFVMGKASFADIGIEGIGFGFTLVYRSTACSEVHPCLPAFSFPFNVTGFPSRLEIVEHPQGGVVFKPFSMQPIVKVLDSMGVIVNWDFDTVVTAQLTPSLNKNASLLGNKEVVCNAGVCLFTDLTIDRGGSKYSLVFDTYLLQSVSSTLFSVQGPSKLTIIQEPGASIVGQPLSIQPAVAVTDDSGKMIHPADSEYLVYVERFEGSGASESNLGGTTSLMTRNGTAWFTDLWFDSVGSRFVLNFSSQSLTAAKSVPFDTEPEYRAEVCSGSQGACDTVNI